MLRSTAAIPAALAMFAALPAQATWTDRTTASTPAFPADCGLAYDSVRHVLVVFGGASASTGLTNDTWVPNRELLRGARRFSTRLA